MNSPVTGRIPTGIAGPVTPVKPFGPPRHKAEVVPEYQNTSSYPSPFASRTRVTKVPPTLGAETPLKPAAPPYQIASAPAPGAYQKTSP